MVVMRLLPSRPGSVLVLATVLFASITAVRFSLGDAVDGYTLLYVLPIALLALGFELLGGLVAAALAMALVFAWGALEDDSGLNLVGYVTRAITFFLLGGLVGFEARQTRRFQVEREQLLARMEAMARTDELTGLLNRRAWDEELRREMERARRDGGRFSVALLDLDRFKQFNDAHGHPAGDDLLRQASTAWRVRVRLVDTLGRYGGEEFALLLPGAAPAGAQVIIDRLRGATPMDQTVSAGIAMWDGEETAEALVGRADRALYQAKRTGRDRCVIAGPA
jgi:diguanylate cyclase (GGDEF)-like protein